MIVGVFYAFALPLVLGVFILRLIGLDKELPRAHFIAIAFLVGGGLLAQVILLLGLCQVPLTVVCISIAVFLTLGAICIVTKFRGSFQKIERVEPLPQRPVKMKLHQWILFMLALLYVLYHAAFILWKAFTMPIMETDALRVHALKAKAVFYEQGLEDSRSFAATYPMHVPLLMAWMGMCVGEWHEGWVKIIIPINFLGFSAVFFLLLRDWTNRFWAMVGVALLFSSLLVIRHAWLAYADLSMAIYAVSTILLLVKGVKEKRIKIMVAAGLMAGLAACTKRTGLMHLPIYILLLSYGILIQRYKPRQAGKMILAFLLPLMMAVAPFFLYKGGIVAVGAFDNFFSQHPDYAQRFINTLHVLAKNLFLSPNWQLMWSFLVVVLIGTWKSERFEIRFLRFGLSLFFGGYMALSLLSVKYAYLGGPLHAESLSRIVLHIFPLCPLLIIICAYEIFVSEKLTVSDKVKDASKAGFQIK